MKESWVRPMEEVLTWHLQVVHALFSRLKESQEDTMDPKQRKERDCESLP